MNESETSKAINEVEVAVDPNPITGGTPKLTSEEHQEVSEKKLPPTKKSGRKLPQGIPIPPYEEMRKLSGEKLREVQEERMRMKLRDKGYLSERDLLGYILDPA